MPQPQSKSVDRVLVILPTWVGDIVMATPTLRALRELQPDAHVACLVKAYAEPLIRSCPWIDELFAYDPKQAFFATVRQLRRDPIDLAIILPNSFRTAAMARLAGAKRRIGYARDGRGWLLTDKLQPKRTGGKFIPYPALQYYLDITRHLGAAQPDPSMALFTDDADDAKAGDMLRQAGVDLDRRPIVLLNPGAKYGDAKLWPAERFAAVADRLAERDGATIIMNGAPAERRILDQVHEAAQCSIVDLPKLGGNLTLLKSFVKLSDLMITNDTGPRHIAAAFNVPVVTIFGPTDPDWTTINFADERIVRVDVDCGPCQLKQCPLDHRCMTRVSVDMVYERCCELLKQENHRDAEAQRQKCEK